MSVESCTDMAPLLKGTGTHGCDRLPQYQACPLMRLTLQSRALLISIPAKEVPHKHAETHTSVLTTRFSSLFFSTKYNNSRPATHLSLRVRPVYP
jgi:hypothetical protein